MDKEHLRELLSSQFDEQKWRGVLSTVFGARQLLGEPVSVTSRLQGPYAAKIDQALDLGRLHTADGKELGLYHLVVQPATHLEQNRAGLRNLLNGLIQQGLDGALVVFEQGSLWRLSLIAETLSLTPQGTIDRQRTPPRRFTYLLGEGRHVRTATDRLAALPQRPGLDHLLNAFSVETLTKDFYRELSDWYFWALGEIEFPADAEPDREKRHATALIRLITRMMFVWFLKEKGLVSPALFDKAELDQVLNYSDSTGSTYYKAILQNLFFATLSTPVDQRKYVNRQTANQHLIRYKRFLKNVNAFEAILDNIPFLNGGLFENLDREDRKTGQRIFIDCFSNHGDNEYLLKVPDYLFFNTGTFADLSAVYDDKKKKQTQVRGLIDILKNYNFTLEENTPLDQEVALDPEMLGKVFENLLAAFNPETQLTARKQTGSFYTPREIVDYMVDECLIAYLRKQFVGQVSYAELGTPQTSLFGNEARSGQLALIQTVQEPLPDSDIEQKLRDLLSYSDAQPFTRPEDCDRLISALDNLTVFDPACGSGAFPMGVLQKMVHVLSKLDKENARWRSRQLQKMEIEVSRDSGKASEIKDPDAREAALGVLKKRRQEVLDAFDKNELNYARKLFLIQNCIYGVDIQPIAIQITKLRFFISLMVDQKDQPNEVNRGIQPLPNLEFKLVAANTLIKPPQGDSVEEGIFSNQRDFFTTEMERLHGKYYSASDPDTKKRLRKEIEKLVDDFKDRKIDAIKKKVSHEDDRAVSALKQKYQQHIQQLEWNIQLWDSYRNLFSHDAVGFFDPRYFFPKIKEGFDIVIGNPPYLRLQGVQASNPGLVDYAKKYYTSASKGNWDLYVLFTEAGYNFLKPGGMLAYIQPHKFFQADFGEGIRKFIAEAKSLYKIVNFGSEQVFSSATNYTCLFFMEKKKRKSFAYVDASNIREWLNAPHQAPVFTLEQPAKDQKWTFTDARTQRLLEKLKTQPLTLGAVTQKIFVGLQTSADNIYVLEVLEEGTDSVKVFSKALNREIQIEKGLVKPFLMGKDVKRYQQPVARNVVIFPYQIRDGKASLYTQQELETRFPMGWAYLLELKAELEGREHGRFVETWWQFSRPQNMAEFQATKIMTRDIANQPEFTLDEGRHYHTTTVYSFVFRHNRTESPSYWLGILNSRLFWFFIQATGNVLRGGFFRFKTEYMKPFPVVGINSIEAQASNLHDNISTLAARVLQRSRQQEDTSKDEARINAWVFRMYGFTEVEMLEVLQSIPEVNEKERRDIQYFYNEPDSARP